MLITIIGVKFTIYDPFYFDEEGTDRINHLQLMTRTTHLAVSAMYRLIDESF